MVITLYLMLISLNKINVGEVLRNKDVIDRGHSSHN